MNSEEIVRLYADMMYKIAFRYARNQYDAEDIVSEVFLTYFRRERTFESEEHRKAWLIKVTINEAKTLLSGRRYDEEINEEIVGGEDRRTDIDDAIDLKTAIARLPEHQREVITLFYLQDFSIVQIAEILDKNKNTVAVTLARARDNLKHFLNAD